MPSGPRRTGFYLGVLAAGFIAGGFLNAFLTKWMPESAAKAFFTSTWTPTLGPSAALIAHGLAAAHGSAAAHDTGGTGVPVQLRTREPVAK